MQKVASALMMEMSLSSLTTRFTRDTGMIVVPGVRSGFEEEEDCGVEASDAIVSIV